MRANQYRLGNLVKYNGKIYEIDSISKEFPTLNTIEYGIGVVDWGNIEPIPLTEEWLFKFGFENSYRQYYWANWGMKVVKDANSESLYNCYQGFLNTFYELTSVKYVHDLQNLFYALSLEELTIKP